MATEERINLATLQQTDPFIKCIKANAKHVTLYTFKADTNEWEKTDVEGTCFVYERSAPPYHGFMILNRLGTKNFIEPIVDTLEFQLKVPFLLYRNPPYIFGVWFYEEKECKSMSDLLQRLVKMAKEPVKPAPAPGADILKLLTKAQTDFVTKSEPPDMSGRPSHKAEMVKPQPVKPDAQPPQFQRQQSITIDDLFKKASLSSSEPQPPPQSISAVLPKLQEPTNTAFKRPLPMDQMTTVTELEREHTPEIPDHVQLLTPASLVGNAGLLPPNVQGYITPGKSDSPLTGELNQAQLMSPMAFSVQPPARRDLGKSIGANQNIPVAINPPQHVNITDTKMIPGFSFARQTSRTLSQSSDPVPLEQDHPGAHASVSALTKEQLRQAMVHLLNTDQQFLETLHAGYIQSLNSTLRR